MAAQLSCYTAGLVTERLRNLVQVPDAVAHRNVRRKDA